MIEFFLTLLTLASISIAQPLFSILSGTPEFLVIRRTSNFEVIVFAALVLLSLPLFFVVLRTIPFLVSKRILKNTVLLSIYDFLVYFCFSFLWILLLFGAIWAAVAGGCLAAALLIVSEKSRSFIKFLSLAAPIFACIFFSSVLSNTFSITSPEAGVKIAKVDASKIKPTFLVIFDEFPLYSLLNQKDEINEDRFPSFARLAKYSTWFRNGSAIASWTERAVPGILSGMLPDPTKRQMPNLEDYPINIFNLLALSHKVIGYEQVTNICPKQICPEVFEEDDFLTRERVLLEDSVIIYLHRLLPRKYRTLLPSIEGRWSNFLYKKPPSAPKKKSHKGLILKENREDDVLLFRDYLQAIRRETPALMAKGVAPLFVIHITFPHVPYRYLPDGRKYFLNLDATNNQGYTTVWPPDAVGASAVALQRLMMQAGMADKLVGELLDTLQQTNILESSVLAVTADHGSSFEPGEYSRRVSNKNYSDVLSVPFFIMMPKDKKKKEASADGPTRTPGNLSEENVSSVDILPTILELNGIQVENHLDGRSLVLPAQAEPEKKLFFPLNDLITQVLEFPARLDRSASINRSISLFGSGGFDERFYRLAVYHPELIGSTLTTTSEQVDPSLVVGVHNQERYQKLRMSPTYLPSVVSGFVKAPKGRVLPSTRQIVAIQVNGAVVTVVETDQPKTGKSSTPDDDLAPFFAIIPPSSLKAGRNDVKGFVLKREQIH